MDNHYLMNPEDLFQAPVADIILDLENPLILEVGITCCSSARTLIILEAHLQCAGIEMPITSEDEQYFSSTMKEICENRLSKDEDGWYVQPVPRWFLN